MKACCSDKGCVDIEFPKIEIAEIVVATIIFTLGIFVSKNSLFLAYVILSWRVFYRAIVNKKVFDEYFLISVATVGAIVIGEVSEAVAVVLLFRIGELLQDYAVNKSVGSVETLLRLKPNFANLKTSKGVVKIRPEEVKVGDTILIRPGERVPLDGVVKEGESFVDVSALTGESVLKYVKAQDKVFSGMVNVNGLLTVEVTKPFEDSTVSKILKLVKEAESRKAKTEKFITEFSRYYTPAVIGLAFLVALLPPFLMGANLDVWIYRALILLVIACPCALVLSVPLSYFASIGKAAREGILIKGANFVDVLDSAKIVALDKTGTLTIGRFSVVDIVPKNGFEKAELLKFAAIAEKNSNHPIAKSIVEEWGELDVDVSKHKEIPGKGVEVEFENYRIVAGNDSLLHLMKIEHDTCNVKGTVVHVAVNGIYAGYVIVADKIKEDSREAVELLKGLGCRVVLVTGDSNDVAERVARELGIDEYYAELMPEDKVKIIEELKKEGKVVFAGDGINDAPVIANADVGFAMGGLGSEAAIDVSDVVIMDDKPSKIPETIKLSRKTKKIVWQNIFFALGIKSFFITLGILGMATMWEAVFADVGVTLIAVLNSMRLLT